MSCHEHHAPGADMIAGILLIVIGVVAALFRAHLLDGNIRPDWTAIELSCALMLIIVGLAVWRADHQQRSR